MGRTVVLIVNTTASNSQYHVGGNEPSSFLVCALWRDLQVGSDLARGLVRGLDRGFVSSHSLKIENEI